MRLLLLLGALGVVVSACVSAGQTQTGAEAPTQTLAGAERQPSESNAISGYGLGIELPPGWDGRIYEDETGLRVVQSANVPLVKRDDAVGNETIQGMGADGIFIALWYWPAWPPPDQETDLDPATLPLQFGRSDFGNFEGNPAPAMAMRAVTVDGNLLQFVVSFGTAHPSDEAVAQANSVLATLRIR